MGFSSYEVPPMTRKRFVKLLMSYGYSRNEAIVEAAEVRRCGFTYENGSLYCFVKSRGVGDALDALAATVDRMVGMIKDGVSYIVERIPAIVEAITAAIPQVIDNIERLKQEAEAATE